MEEDLHELGRLAGIAPFLLLTHSFAVQVKSDIDSMCESGTAGRVPERFYRGRDIPESSASVSDFGPPPPAITKEGRYNHAGRPVVYLASDPATCWAECRRPGKEFTIATIEIFTDIRILDLTEPDELCSSLAALTYSNLMTAPMNAEGWNRPEYVLTRFVADCARLKSVDAIKYPSSRCGSGDNLVLLTGSRFDAVARVVGCKEYRTTWL
jgi:RES domain-containing protein